MNALTPAGDAEPAHSRRSPHGRHDDLDALKLALLDRLEDLAHGLLGEPNRETRNRKEWRWGSKGSAALVVSGPKRGLFYNHEAGVGGGPLDLIAHARSCSVAEAIRWARDYLGAGFAAPIGQDVRADRERRAAERAAADAADRARRIKGAQTVAAESVPLSGTAGAVYLTVTRGIPEPAGGWPDDAVRFHPDKHALVVKATDASGEVRAVQLVYLTCAGTKIDDSERECRELPAVKQTFGFLEGAAVRLPGDAAGPLLLAEGPETGLSIWAATGHETLIALGSIAQLDLPVGRRIVACRDDDPRFRPADRRLTEAVTGWRKAGHKVAVATPWNVRRFDGSDFNDAIQAGGVAAVAARIAAALNPGGGPGRPLVDLETGRAQLEQPIARFFRDALYKPSGPDAPVSAIKADVGLGKSAICRKHAAGMLRRARAREEDCGPVAFSVPTHQLGQEAADAFEAAAAGNGEPLKAAVWRGRTAADPDAPGSAMCLNLSAVKDAIAAGVRVRTACCIARQPDGTVLKCPFFDTCGYERQMQRTAAAWFVPHEMLFLEKPTTIGAISALVVDESVWATGLGEPFDLPLTAFDAIPSFRHPSPRRQAQLAALRARAVQVLRQAAEGPLSRAAMLDAGFTARDAAEGGYLEWRGYFRPALRPGMAPGERKAAVAAGQHNRLVRRMGAFWRALGELLKPGGAEFSGWIKVGTTDADGIAVPALRIATRKDLRKGWKVPTLLIDATLDMSLVTPFFPQAKLVADIAIEARRQTVRQMPAFSFSKRRLAQRDDKGETDAARRHRNLRSVHAFIAREARRHAPGRVLVVLQKEVEEALPEFGRLPSNVVTAHHNAIAGRDEWRDVAALIVVGRTQPSPAQVEQMADVLSGTAGYKLPGWYEKAPAVRIMADGDTVQAEVDRHPDPTAEAVRWQICEGELVQIIGRARGINRTAGDPVEILVLTDPVLPLPLAEVLAPDAIKASAVDLMLAASGVALDDSKHAARAFPHLFATPEAARQAFTRQRSVTFPNKESSNTGLSHSSLLKVDFQLAGAGNKAAVAWVDTDFGQAIKPWLEARLGCVAWCRVDGREIEAGPVKALAEVAVPWPLLPPIARDGVAALA